MFRRTVDLRQALDRSPWGPRRVERSSATIHFMTSQQPENGGAADASGDGGRFRRLGTWARRVGWALSQVGLAAVSPADLLVTNRSGRSSTSSRRPDQMQARDQPSEQGYAEQYDSPGSYQRGGRLRRAARTLGQVVLPFFSPADLGVPLPRRLRRRRRPDRERFSLIDGDNSAAPSEGDR